MTRHLSRTLLAAALAIWLMPSSEASAQQAPLTVYLIDHQRVSREELTAIQAEIESIFQQQAGIPVTWILDDSPRRALDPRELRFLILASDGTRWFQGPSNVIGLAPHDDSGIGRNCFVFYRQALWFRQQAVLRCREATRVRSQAADLAVEPDPSVADLAPPECGDQLPSLTPMIVARAAAHEMVHILLNKFDHSADGLMRESFDIKEWLSADDVPFRLLPDEIDALQRLFASAVAAGSR